LREVGQSTPHKDEVVVVLQVRGVTPKCERRVQRCHEIASFADLGIRLAVLPKPAGHLGPKPYASAAIDV